MDLRSFADEVAGKAESFPWEPFPADVTDPEAKNQPVPFLWVRYHYACVVACRRLFRSFLLHHDAGLEFESAMPLRSLLELVSVQHGLLHDKGSVLKLLAEAAVARETVASDLGASAARNELEWDADEHSQGARRYRDLIEGYVEDFPRQGSMPWPFGKKPKQRLEDAGLADEWYDLIYRRASNLVHMNASVLETYVRWEAPKGFNLPELRSGAEYMLDRAIWLVIRLLRHADIALRQGHDDELTQMYLRWKEVSPAWRDHGAGEQSC